jgi:hypothetical protein
LSHATRGIPPQGKAITLDQQRIQELQARIKRLKGEQSILKSYRTHDARKNRTYEVIDEICSEEFLELICAVFDVARSCLYDLRERARTLMLSACIAYPRSRAVR